jgi:hypothetical protein
MDQRGEFEFFLHEHLLPLFGMPIGSPRKTSAG